MGRGFHHVAASPSALLADAAVDGPGSDFRKRELRCLSARTVLPDALFLLKELHEQMSSLIVGRAR